jgi:hypothetical protein
VKWFWQRRKKDAPVADGAVAVATAPRAAAITARPAPSAELRDDLLRFARDVLVAQGAHVRAEEDDLLLATLPDGGVARYTTTLARARAEEETTLLAQGAAALETFFDDAAQHARLVALRLSPTSTDPTVIALERLAPLAETACGRCVGRGGEGWLADAPTCAACPLRSGRPALTWAEPPVAGRALRQSETWSVELVYRLIGRDRRGRRDEWLRLAFDSATGRMLTPIELILLAAAQPATSPADSRAMLAAASAHAQERLLPALDTLAALLRQRVADDYQRRIVEVTTTHERLRRERPDETTAIAGALDRELASLAEVYGVEVEARLESVAFISSTSAQVAIEMANGLGPTVAVDLGRGVVSGPACAVCGEDVRAGHVCARGHAVCARHASVCAHCATPRCPVCEPAAATTCALCGDPTCDACATACDECGRAFCALHTWRCAEGDHTLCLEHLNVCEACGDPLCPTHTLSCGACGARRCQRHARACTACGEARCETHALVCATCGAALCEAHAARCEQCGRSVCAADSFACLGCGRTLCACAGIAACASCGADYCAACREEGGACPACRALEAATDADLLALAQAAEREPAISLKRKWQVGRNARARVYVARGLGFEEAWALTDEGEVIETRRKGWLAR